MYTLIIILTVLVSLLLIVVVLVQKSKGGGLSSSFAGSNQIMGVRRTNDFIEKATWTLVASLVVLSILSVYAMPRRSDATQLRTQPVAAPAAAEAPAGQFDTPAATLPVAEVEETAVEVEAPAEAPAQAE